MSSLRQLIPASSLIQQIPLKCKILIDNVGIGSEESVTLTQGFNQHHTFIVKGKIENSKPDGDISLQWLEDIRNFIGKYITIQFESQTSTQSNDFAGIVTHVNILQQADYLNTYIIEGYSKTWILENGPSYRMYQNRSIHNIITDINSKNQCNLRIEADATNNTDLNIEHALISQYAETDFHFLNRIALTYGHRFYYDQNTLYFGKPKKSNPSIPLIFRKNLYNYEANHQLKTNYNQVLNHYFNNDNNLYKNTVWPKLTEEQYGQHAVYNITETNKWLKTTSQHIVPIQDDSQGNIEQYQKKQQAQTASEVYVLHCQTTEYTLHPGSIITIQRPLETDGEPKLLGEYIVQYITHEYSFVDGLYYNKLIAIPNTPEAFPHSTQYIQPIQAQPQLAEVISTTPNLQQKVQVRFHWSSDDYYSPWLRVAQPNWGNNEKSDGRRGFYFLPSKGDLVCVNFLHGNPNFPYISHSIPHGKNIAGLDNINNYLRHISTPIGHTIAFNDNPENPSINIIDNNGNSISINSKESKIYITGQKGVIIKGDEITLESKNTHIASTEKLTIKADTQLKIGSQEKIMIEGGKRLDLNADNLKIEARKELKELGNAVNIAAKDCLSIYGQTLNAHGQCGLNLKSPQLNKDINPDVMEANFTKPAEDLQFVALFYPDIKTYIGRDGSIDWAEWDEKGNLIKVQNTRIEDLEYIYDETTKDYFDKYVPVSKDTTALLRLRNEYEYTKFYTYPYIIPYLSIMPNQDPLQLKMEVKFLNKNMQPDPEDYLTFDDNEYYDVIVGGKINKEIKYTSLKNGLVIGLSIKCKKEASQQQELIARDKVGGIVGKMNILPNTKIYKPIVYVVCIVKDDQYKDGWITDMLKRAETTNIKTIFNQSLMDFDVKINPDWHIAFNEDEWAKLKIFDKEQNCFRNSPESPDNVKDLLFKKLTTEQQELIQKNILCLITNSYLKTEDGKGWVGGIGSTKSKTIFITDRDFDYKIENSPRQTLQHEVGHIFGLEHIFYEGYDIDDKNITKLKTDWESTKVNINTKEKELAKMQLEYDVYKYKTGKLDSKSETQINDKIEKLQDDYTKCSNIEAEYNKTRFARVCRNNKYKFRKHSTKNPMDYDIDTTTMGKRPFFFKWQWDIIRAEAEKYHNNTTEQNKIK